jgi:hypothetical protein
MAVHDGRRERYHLAEVPPGHAGAQLVDDAGQAGAVIDAGRPP